MNNVTNPPRFVRPTLSAWTPLLLAFVFALSFGTGKATASSAVAPSPASATDITLATTPDTNNDAKPPESSSSVSEESKPEDLSNLSTQDAISLLRNGNSGEALNVRQLAAINNLIKRMDYISQIEKKMNEMSASLGSQAPIVSPSSALSPGPSPSPLSPSGGPSSDLGSSPISQQSASSYNVLRVNGASGDYSALISNGSSQIRVKQGDNTTIGRIASVSLDGVTVMTASGLVPLAFSAPSLLSGVTTTTMGR